MNRIRQHLFSARNILEALYLQCLMHRRNAMQEIPELKGLSETCNRIYKLQDVDVLFQCLLMDQMDWEEEKLYVQFSTIYLLKQTVKIKTHDFSTICREVVPFPSFLFLHIHT